MLDYISSWCKSKRIINGHTVIITGSNTGIGRETASDLYARGYDLDMDDLNFEIHLYDAYKAYCRSKAANVLFARGLANELKKLNIQDVNTYSVHPGVIKTGIGRHYDETVLHGATWLFNNVLGLFLKSPRCGAQTTIYCAIDESCANETGLYYSDCAVKVPSKQCKSDMEAARLWAVTMEFLMPHLHKFDPFGDSDPSFSD